MCGGRRGHSVGAMDITRLLPLTAVCALALWPAAAQAAGRTQTLRVFDKTVSVKLTKADGTVVGHAPFPDPQPGDVLDADSLDFVGTHAHHAKHWTMSSHTRCTFTANSPEPSCVSHVAIGGSLLVFTDNEITDSTGIYHGATGRIVSEKELPDNASDIVAKIHLH
jgi:hypothetical protein